MENRILDVRVDDHSLDPVSAELRVIVTPERLTPTTEVHGRLVGPSCPYASTVEVAYPLTPLRQTGPTVPGALRLRVVIPEPSLWDTQSPYLYAVSIIANATSPGTRFDSLSMNRRGDVALRGSMRDGQQVADFRSKLIHSGLFSKVVIEEQTPTPDRQKVIVRISAQWKPGASRESLSIEPPVSDLDKSREKGASAPAAPNPSLRLKDTKE